MGSSIIMIAAMFAVLYFIMIRPEQKRKKKAQEMRDNLKKGDRITTIGGIVAKVVSVQSESIVVETSDDRVRMELMKWAVSQVNAETEEKAEEKTETPEIAEEAASEEKND